MYFGFQLYIYINENFIYSACFLNDNNNIFIITNAYFSISRQLDNEIKVFDLNGERLGPEALRKYKKYTEEYF